MSDQWPQWLILVIATWNWFVNPISCDEQHHRVASVPKFGAWDELDPKSGEGFTVIFNKVKEEKQIAASQNAAMRPTQSSYYSNAAHGQGHGRSSYRSKVYIYNSKWLFLLLYVHCSTIYIISTLIMILCRYVAVCFQVEVSDLRTWLCICFHKLARHDHCSDDREQVKAKAKLVLASWLVLIKFIRESAHQLILLYIWAASTYVLI
jgi:hypothetical protein